MANTLNLGSGNWGVKDSSLLGYKNRQNGRFIPETFDVARGSAGTRVNQSGLIETPEEILSADLVTNGDFSQEGAELITNGDFATDTDWTTQVGWGIANGKASKTLNNASYLLQSTILTIGKSYKVTFTVSDYVSGEVGLNSTFWGSSNLYSANGTYTVYAPTSSANMYIYSDASFVGSIDNVSVKEVGQDWTLGTGVVISGGKAVLTNVNTSVQAIGQFSFLEIGKTYKITFTISDYVQGGIYILRPTSLGSGSAVSANGTFSFTTEAQTSASFILYTLGTTTLSVDNVSVVEVNRDNLARIDYLDDAAGVLLTEPQRSNLITYSEDFSNASWTKQTGITPTYNTTETLSPDGSYNATKFVGNGSSGVYVQATSLTGVITRSVYLKSVTGTTTATFKDPYTSAITPISLTITNEWQRFEMIGDNGSSVQGLWIDDIPSDGLYMWGSQLEEGSYPTSYIPTEGVAATRLADVVTNAGDVNNFNSEEGVLFAEINFGQAHSSSRYIALSDGTNGNRVIMGVSANVTATLTTFVSSGGSTQANMSFPINLSENHKVALKYKENDFSLWIDGVRVFSDNSGLTPIGLDTLRFSQGDLNNNFYGKTKNIQVFDTALSDAELITLTTI